MVEQASSKFAEKVATAMEARDVDINALSQHCETTYEHTRKIVKGLAFPSKHMLRSIATYLKLDQKELEKLATEDKVIRKYGSAAFVLSGKDPRLAPFEPYLANLTDRDLSELLEMAKTKAKMNKQAAKAAG